MAAGHRIGVAATATVIFVGLDVNARNHGGVIPKNLLGR